jgi:hypothetical protein
MLELQSNLDPQFQARRIHLLCLELSNQQMTLLAYTSQILMLETLFCSLVET